MPVSSRKSDPRSLVAAMACAAVSWGATLGDGHAAAAAELDREDVLARARERAVAIAAARSQVESAEGNLVAAKTWRFNPELEIQGGPRSRSGEETTWDRYLNLSQRLDLAGRGDRIAAATAARRAAADESRAAEVAVVAEAAALYLRALHAVQRRNLAEDALTLHERLRDIARRRRAAGEIGALGDNLAAVALARAEAGLARAAAADELARGELATMLVLENAAHFTLSGELSWPLPAALDSVLATAQAHPLLRAVTAREEEAAATIEWARSARSLGFKVTGGFGREEGADLIRLGVGVGLPVFARGQGETQTAAARHALARTEAVALRTTLGDRVERAWRRHARLSDALASFGAEVEPALTANVRLAEESYRLGKIDLGQVLQVQREYLEARGDLVDLRLDTALAALEVAATAALPPLALGPAESTRSE
jgi:outer membrane protein TolC